MADRGPVSGASAVVVFVISFVSSVIVTDVIPRVAGRKRSILSRGGGGRIVEIQEFVCMLLLLTSVSTLLLLALFRVATHDEFQNILPCVCVCV